MAQSRFFIVAAEPFNLVGIDVRRRHFHRGRQIDDHRVLRGWLPDVHDRLADLQGKIKLGAGKALRRIFVTDLGCRLPGLLADDPRPGHPEIDDLFASLS